MEAIMLDVETHSTFQAIFNFIWVIVSEISW